MDSAVIIDYIARTFPGVDVLTPREGVGAGDTFFSYDPEGNLDPKRRFPFATLVTKDYGEFDCTSNLNRLGVFRLNIGVGKDTFQALFGGGGAYDYAALDRLMPHPVYAAQWFVCVLNPSEGTFASVQPLLAEAYANAVRRHPSSRRAQ